MIKYGEVLDYKTADKAVIGKNYIFGDVFKQVSEEPEKYKTGVLLEVDKETNYPFRATDHFSHQFCREVIDEEVLMTNRELAEWCSEGKGLWKHNPSNSETVYHYYWFLEPDMNKRVPDNIVIMPKGSDEWVKPTVEIYERDCGKKI